MKQVTLDALQRVNCRRSRAAVFQLPHSWEIAFNISIYLVKYLHLNLLSAKQNKKKTLTVSLTISYFS